jgi:hypothetical protein
VDCIFQLIRLLAFSGTYRYAVQTVIKRGGKMHRRYYNLDIFTPLIPLHVFLTKPPTLSVHIINICFTHRCYQLRSSNRFSWLIVGQPVKLLNRNSDRSQYQIRILCRFGFASFHPLIQGNLDLFYLLINRYNQGRYEETLLAEIWATSVAVDTVVAMIRFERYSVSTRHD